MADVPQTLPLDDRSGEHGTPGVRSWLVVAFRSDLPFELPTAHALDAIDKVSVERGAERAVGRHDEGGIRTLTLRLPDASISSKHFSIVRAGDGRVLRDAGSRNGTRLNGLERTVYPIGDGDIIEAGRCVFVYREAKITDGEATLGLDAGLVATPSGFATISPVVAAQLALLPRLSASKIAVLLHAETGTGKELIARALHDLSGRRGPFIAVNCGAIPATMVEAELFGHRRGAFSGATEDRPGLVRAADGGTLLLDEIGDLPLACQAAFLRVLQTHRVRPIGDARELPVDVRVVAATHRDLGAMAAQDAFRADLYARIAGYTLSIPPLRGRKEDIGHVVAAVLRRHGVTAPLTAAAARALFRYDWPRNVRELETCIESAVLVAGGRPLDVAHLPEVVRQEGAGPVSDRPPVDSGPLDEAQLRHRDELIALLRDHGGNVSAVARATGKARMQIQRWMKRYGITPRGV